MSSLLLKVIWYKYSDGYSTPKNITNMIDLRFSKGVDIQNNILNFKVKIFDDTFVKNGDILFNERDQIKIWARYVDDSADITSDWDRTTTTEPSTNYLVGVYYVIEFNTVHDENKKIIEVKCADKTYVLFSRLLPFTSTIADGKTAPELIQKIIRMATETQDTNNTYLGTGSDSGVYYEIDAKLEDAESGYVTDIRSDASVFPDVSIAKVWKPVYEYLKDLSQVEYTNTTTEIDNNALVYGRPFIFWIDELNKFHWVYPSNDNPTVMDVGVDIVKSASIKKAVFDVTNFIIFNAGNDMYGSGILDYHYDETSTSNTLKMRYMSFIDVSKTLIQNEINAGNLVLNASGTFTFNGNRYNRNGTVTAKFDNTSYSADATYNTALRVASKFKGKSRAKNITFGLSHARWKGSVEVKGQHFTQGTLIQYTDSEIGITNQYVRIVDINHSFTQSGWFTSLTIEQDPESLNMG